MFWMIIFIFVCVWISLSLDKRKHSELHSTNFNAYREFIDVEPTMTETEKDVALLIFDCYGTITQPYSGRKFTPISI